MVVWTSNDRSCLPCLLGSKKVQMKASVKDLSRPFLVLEFFERENVLYRRRGVKPKFAVEWFEWYLLQCKWEIDTSTNWTICTG